MSSSSEPEYDSRNDEQTDGAMNEAHEPLLPALHPLDAENTVVERSEADQSNESPLASTKSMTLLSIPRYRMAVCVWLSLGILLILITVTAVLVKCKLVSLVFCCRI